MFNSRDRRWSRLKMPIISTYNISYLILLSLFVQFIESAPDPLDKLTINVNIGGSDTDDTVKCGVKKKGTKVKSGTSRIVGGNETEVNEYPWIVAFKYGHYHSFHCGGSVIADKWILTAGHCLHGRVLEQIELVLGEHNQIIDTESSITKIVKPNLMISHPKYVYDRKGTAYDIALLRIPPIDTKIYTPICLPAQGANYDNKKAWIYGWGNTQPRHRSRLSLTKLLDAPVHVVSDAEGYAAFAKGIEGYKPPRILTDEELEVMNFAGDPGKDTCQGDSGGPMSYANPDNNGRHEQIGITSWGWGCAGITPGVYTEVSALTSWIEDQMSNNGGA